jgi:nicotinate-nucleotide adenylyltransferase
MGRIGILGGTFDPPHHGHLLIAQETLSALKLDEVWFIPTNKPPHKSQSKTNTLHRLQMLKLAVADNEQFQVNELELDRNGPSYSIDTMYILKERYPSFSFYFIIGGDMVDSLHTWERINELLELVTFVGVKRPGFLYKTKYPIVEVEIPVFDVSSSLIRNRYKEGKNVRYFLPEKVRQYIEEINLYE